MDLENIRTNEFYELSSEISGLPSRESLVDAIREYDYVVQFTYDGVEIVEALNYECLPDGLLELRAFNKLGELHAIDLAGELRGRVRLDSPGIGAAVFDEEHLLWGSIASEEEGCYVLREDRGTRVSIPKSALPGAIGGSLVTIRVRNYLEEGSLDPDSGDTRFTFSDYRFVCFDVREGE